MSPKVMLLAGQACSQAVTMVPSGTSSVEIFFSCSRFSTVSLTLDLCSIFAP